MEFEPILIIYYILAFVVTVIAIWVNTPWGKRELIGEDYKEVLEEYRMMKKQMVEQRRQNRKKQRAKQNKKN